MNEWTLLELFEWNNLDQEDACSLHLTRSNCKSFFNVLKCFLLFRNNLLCKHSKIFLCLRNFHRITRRESLEGFVIIWNRDTSSNKKYRWTIIYCALFLNWRKYKKTLNNRLYKLSMWKEHISFSLYLWLLGHL